MALCGDDDTRLLCQQSCSLSISLTLSVVRHVRTTALSVYKVMIQVSTVRVRVASDQINDD